MRICDPGQIKGYPSFIEFGVFSKHDFRHVYHCAWMGRQLAVSTAAEVQRARADGKITRIAYCAWRTWYRAKCREPIN